MLLYQIVDVEAQGVNHLPIIVETVNPDLLRFFFPFPRYTIRECRKVSVEEIVRAHLRHLEIKQDKK